MVQGYAELLLADLFCSGVPLSAVRFEGDFTYAPPSTTKQVYQHAIALFDTALTLSSDSVNTLNAARVGRGRAFLALGDYTSAAAAVARVPGDFRYGPIHQWQSEASNSELYDYTVSDSEGIRGPAYVSANDPRVPVISKGINGMGRTLYAPGAYPGGGVGQVVVASGIEASLIRAEAALHGALSGAPASAMTDTLNALRATVGLPALQDPGTDTGRVTQLFQERGYWLYLSGHRQGDLRRLVRAPSGGGYGRAQSAVYPSGPYPESRALYGSDVLLPIPNAERNNPYFTACLDLRA